MSDAAKPRLEYFWDVSSPYTYLAWTQLKGVAERTGAQIVYRPFLLGGVFKATGNSMPAAVAAKAVYLAKDLERWREAYGVPLRIPIQEVVFPINSVLSMRVATALGRRGQGEAICAALMRGYWEDGRDVSTEAVLREVLGAMQLDPDEILAEAVSPEVKLALRETSDEAVARGAFGAPSLFVGDQMFFGNDRMHFVEAALNA